MTGSAVETRSDGADAALVRCLELPGAPDVAGAKLSDPIMWVVPVDGTASQTTVVRDCLGALPDAKVQALPDAQPTEARGTFYVRYDGTADSQAYRAGVTECTALSGVSGNATGEMFPGDYKLSGDDADALANCLNAVPGAKIDRTEGSPADGPGLAASIARCVGVGNIRPAPEYVGLSEDEATRIEQPESADGVNAVRVVGRDGDCLGRTRDLRNDRVNVLVADGSVVWAGRF